MPIIVLKRGGIPALALMLLKAILACLAASLSFPSYFRQRNLNQRISQMPMINRARKAAP